MLLQRNEAFLQHSLPETLHSISWSTTVRRRTWQSLQESVLFIWSESLRLAGKRLILVSPNVLPRTEEPTTYPRVLLGP
jgi:hypothetical protein